MIKNNFFAMVMLLAGSMSMAQTTETFIVADNGEHMASCQDTTIDINDIYIQRGIRDLNDPNDNVNSYVIKRLEGSVILEEITGPFKYSDYPAVYIEKTGEHHGGVVIFLSLITRPTSLFDKDTLNYTVERGAKVNIGNDFFESNNFWSSGMDVLPFQERILFTDLSNGIELPVSQAPNWSLLGKGIYRIRQSVSVCTANDIFKDSIFVKIVENPCHSIEIKNLPPVCRDAVIDLTPYVFVDGQPATSSELAEMTFKNKSDIVGGTSELLDATSVDLNPMWNNSTRFPRVEISYQPNISLGTCQVYNTFLSTKVPAKFLSTDLVLGKDLSGYTITYTMDDTYYSFNNAFHKNVLTKLYLDNYDSFEGTTFRYYTDNTFQNEVTGDDLSPGSYVVRATHPDCENESTEFDIQIVDRDFEITWQGATNYGKGYYTFTAEDYPGATYDWFVWGGSIVAGKNSRTVIVYYSEEATQSVTVRCQITLAAENTKIAADGGILNSALYLTTDGEGEKEVITPEITTGIYANNNSNHQYHIYPNPTDGVLSIAGEGELDLKIYDAFGRIVLENKNYMANTPVTIYSKGIHFIHLSKNGYRQTLKVIVK